MSGRTKKHSRLFGAFLWFLAVLIMFAAVIYQRRTGPTYPKRGTVEVGAEVQPYRLIRSEETIRPARVAIPDPGPSGSGTVYYRRYPTADSFTAHNKTLIMFIAWLVACSTVGPRPKKKEGVGRAAVIVAAIVMTGVYLVPHSMRGSELDYEAVDRGVDPSEAVGTSDQ